MSAELRYPDRHAYTAWHILPLLYGWWSGGYALEHLLLTQVGGAVRGWGMRGRGCRVGVGGHRASWGAWVGE